MLNRRSLRVKGMQAIFAYQTSKAAEYNICRRSAQDQFLPDLTSMEEQDKDALKENQKQVGEIFDSIHQNSSSIDESRPELIKAAKHYLSLYENKLKESHGQIKRRMIDGFNDLFGLYIKLLYLILDMEEVITASKVKRSNPHNNFKTNKVIILLRNFNLLEAEKNKKNLQWDGETLRTWYKEFFRSSQTYQDYDNSSNPSFETDHAFVLEFYKSIIFKNALVNDYFESIDLGWAENKSILKSMVLKTIKSIESEEETPKLMELSKNWDDDLDFLKRLFDATINSEKEYQEMINQKSKNWEIERLALTDRIVLEMAVAELINFPSIPIKVTINEYIELSKQYSTPKSKQYVNGLLDVLSVDLQKEGFIKKSGRGLLDNK